jgi:hypothetical protein
LDLIGIALSPKEVSNYKNINDLVEQINKNLARKLNSDFGNGDIENITTYPVKIEFTDNEIKVTYFNEYLGLDSESIKGQDWTEDRKTLIIKTK